MPQPLTRRRSKEIASLSRRKGRDALGLYLVEGVRAVEAALDAEAPLVEILTTHEAREDDRVAVLLHRAEDRGLATYALDAREADRLADTRHTQGVLATCRPRLAADDDLLCATRVLALDGVQDPGNVGTLVRTAAWFGLDVVIAGPGTADPFAPKTVRAAMGGLHDVAVARADDLAALLETMRQHGFGRYGADAVGTPANVWQPQARSVLVLGSEAHGLAPATRAALDDLVALPGDAARRGTESLNVSIAGGILLYAWTAK